jgi:hypothetical protein
VRLGLTRAWGIAGSGIAGSSTLHYPCVPAALVVCKSFAGVKGLARFKSCYMVSLC